MCVYTHTEWDWVKCVQVYFVLFCISVGVGRYHFSLRLAPPEHQSTQGQGFRKNRHTYIIAMGMQNGVVSMEGSLAVCTEWHTHLCFDSAILRLEVKCKDKVKKKYKNDVCTRLFIVWYIHTMEEHAVS